MRRAWLRLSILVLVMAGCGDRGQEANGQPPVLGLVAGSIGGRGNADGTGADARFSNPRGVAVDSAGNVYVAEMLNNTIRKITPAGEVTTLAGAAGVPGSADGAGADARFNQPSCVAVDGVDNLYVADFGNHTIRKITPDGDVTTLAGVPHMPGSTDGTGAAAQFSNPDSVAVDSTGNLYVADFGNDTIRTLAPDGTVSTLAGTAGTPGSVDGNGPAAQFTHPTGVAVDGAGNVYVADHDNNTIREITTAGDVSTLAGAAGMCTVGADGIGVDARLCGPQQVAVGGDGDLYVADFGDGAIRKNTPAGEVTTLAGSLNMSGSSDGTGAAAQFDGPSGVAVDAMGNVYVADMNNQTIRVVTAAGAVTTLAGAPPQPGSVDDTGSAARFVGPEGVAVDGASNVYVADALTVIRKVTLAGEVTTLAGDPSAAGGTVDGTGAAARFNEPQGVAVDGAGNIYVADRGNHTIRKVTPAGVVTTLAGTADMSGSADGSGVTALFNSPQGVAVDHAGNIYVADTGNSTIRKVTPAGAVTTLAGLASVPGSTDGAGSAARFTQPVGVAVDRENNVYIADTGNHTIRKITPTGAVTTWAGVAGKPGSASGIRGIAQFHSPSHVVVDSADNVYVADTGNATIRKVTPFGVIYTVAGTAGVTGVLLGSKPRFASPRGLAIVGDSLVVSDANAILLLEHAVQ